MASNILSGRFDNGDFESWLREFEACCDANGWKVTGERDEKILKLPAFHFSVARPHKRKTYKDATKELKKYIVVPCCTAGNFVCPI